MALLKESVVCRMQRQMKAQAGLPPSQTVASFDGGDGDNTVVGRNTWWVWPWLWQGATQAPGSGCCSCHLKLGTGTPRSH